MIETTTRSATAEAHVAGELVDYSDVRASLRHTMYLTGVSNDLTRAEKRNELGVLVTPASSIHRQTGEYAFFGADNGLYNENHPTKGFEFDDEKWLAWLDKLDRSTCLFVTLPDVLNWTKIPHPKKAGKMLDVPIGDCDATIARSAKYVDAVKELGFGVALVAQDGLRSLSQIPFAVDAIFIGGSDEYKLGPDAAGLVAEARELGLWVHVGRVNSCKRMRYSASIGADSADGTFLSFCSTADKPAQHARMIGWLDALLADSIRDDVAAVTDEIVAGTPAS